LTNGYPNNNNNNNNNNKNNNKVKSKPLELRSRVKIKKVSQGLWSTQTTVARQITVALASFYRFGIVGLLKKKSELWDLSIFPDSELWDLFFWNISRFGIVRLIFRSYGTSEKIRNCGTYFRFGIVRLIFRKYGILPMIQGEIIVWQNDTGRNNCGAK
jgi:hypothetical protein